MRIWVAVMALALAACHKSDMPKVSDAWATLASGGAEAADGYFTFDNRTDFPMDIAGLYCPKFASSDITSASADHPSLQSLPVAPHTVIKLRPGGFYARLAEPIEPPAIGKPIECGLSVHRGELDSVDIHFQFEVKEGGG